MRSAPRSPLGGGVSPSFEPWLAIGKVRRRLPNLGNDRVNLLSGLRALDC